MILKPEEFEYDFKKRNECIQECQEDVKNGRMSQENMDYLCDIERFAPYPWNVGDYCFQCGGQLTFPAIAWAGHAKDGPGLRSIAMHPDCVTHMFNGLKNDWHEWRAAARVISGMHGK
jgi:hypothetical protein